MFLGSDDVAAACLRELVRTSPVALAVTQPARRRGRSGAESPTPVAAAAASLGIDVLATSDVNAQDALGRVAAASPRLLVVVAFGQMLRRAVRETAPLGGVNLHFSLLPRWRGAAPVQRAILAGDAETGVAVQRVVAKLDAGPVLAVERTPIGPRETTPELMRRLAGAGAPLLGGVVARLLAGETLPESPQDERFVSYAAKVGRAEGDLAFDREDAAALDRRIRAFAAAPGCRARVVRASGDVEVLVGEAVPEAASGEPGVVLAAAADGIVVAARSGALRITRLQRPGGRLLDARAFLNGCAVREGDHFASSALSAS